VVTSGASKCMAKQIVRDNRGTIIEMDELED
jgi:hypothetical protein